MPKKNELKLGNPQISIIRKWANFSEPWNLTILEDAIFQLFFQSHAPKVPEWKIAHIEWSKKGQNTRKSPKNEWSRRSYVNPPFWEHPVYHLIVKHVSSSTVKLQNLHMTWSLTLICKLKHTTDMDILFTYTISIIHTLTSNLDIIISFIFQYYFWLRKQPNKS